jgi:hypothetical protein
MVLSVEEVVMIDVVLVDVNCTVLSEISTLVTTESGKCRLPACDPSGEGKEKVPLYVLWSTARTMYVRPSMGRTASSQLNEFKAKAALTASSSAESRTVSPTSMVTREHTLGNFKEHGLSFHFP